MWMLRRTLAWVLGVLVILCYGVAVAATVEVGTCQNGFPQFPTIQAAVTAASAGATVLVCPGIYPEQVTIDKTLTLQGVALSTASGATISAPSGGIVANTNSLATGQAIAAQVLVQNAKDVDIHNLTVDGSNNGLLACSPTFIGIIYQNASGTISHDVVLNQALSAGLTGCQSGLAIFAQSGSGGSSNLYVHNSTVNAYQKNGITGNETGTGIRVADNTVIGQGPTTGAAENGIQVGFGAAGRVTGNVVIDDVWAPATLTGNAAASGILVFASSDVTVHNNKVGNAQFGIAVVSDQAAGLAEGSSITSNTISASHIFDGIEVCSNNNTIHDNTIDRSDESGIHLDSGCTNPDSSTTGKGNKVKDNVVNSACAGILVGTLTSVAANSISDNDFFNVESITPNADTCPAPTGALRTPALSNVVSAGQSVRFASPVRP